MEGPAGSPELQAEAVKYDKLQAEQEASDLQFVMSDPRGRRLMYRIIFRVARAESLSYSEHNDRTNFLEGHRSVGLKLMSETQEVTPELYLEMIAEALKDGADRVRRMKRIQETAHARADGPDDSL